MAPGSIRISAPGRLCLFGEHSDYIGLDVIPMAINLAIDIEVTPREDKEIVVNYVNLKVRDSFSLDLGINYRNKRDYVRSAFNVMKRKGSIPKHGADIRVSGNIPLSAGLSSSSALTVGAVVAVASMSGKVMEPEEVAQTAFEAEVVEFGESGGFQDHYASAVGGVIHLNVKDEIVTRLPSRLGSIVVGDSGEQKTDTVGDIRYIKTIVEREYEMIEQNIDSFDRRNTPVKVLYELAENRHTEERRIAEATLRNRDLTKRALSIMSSTEPDHQILGEMLREHHEILRDGLDRSTPKIERMIEASMEAGALGCKINGSGGGGSMMAYAPGLENEVASAIQLAGGTPYIVTVGKGVQLSKIEP